MANENMYTAENGFSFGETPIHGPVPEDAVREAERILDVEFPPSYRNFLLHIGAVGDIAGLSGPPAPEQWYSFPDVVRLSRVMRGDRWNDRPTAEAERRLLYLDTNGEDLKYFLDPSQVDRDGEHPVIIHGPGSDFVIFAKNFVDFIPMTYGVD